MIKRGQEVIVRRYPDNGELKARDEYAKVLCISDGYVMLRHKGAMPFLKSLKDLEKLNER